MRRKIAPVPSHKVLISTHFLPTPLSRFASKGGARGLEMVERSSSRPAQEINSFIITNNPRALLADIGDAKTLSLSLSFSLSFLVANERIAEDTRREKSRRVCELRYNIH
jgi:hypothetical protein